MTDTERNERGQKTVADNTLQIIRLQSLCETTIVKSHSHPFSGRIVSSCVTIALTDLSLA